MNFCPNCGETLENNQNFCTNCGYSINGEKNNSVDNNSVNNQNNFNINEPAPVGIKGGLNRDLKEPQILSYKQKMGLKTGIENVLIGQVANMGKMVVSAAWASLSVKFFVLSFEEQGIVLMGVNMQGKFNGKNAFITKDSISETKHRAGFLKQVVTIISNGGKNKFYCPSMVLGSSFQSHNVKNIDEILNKY
ncbi:zinc-ribbon domain-containing protein [Apilactobacillus timberlakei]|uniref:Zinc ribbon domain-containing protein n=1 Tax=Apilactobacillus timberlakei TaxID=2008380 RepID=A0ABY2YRH8_9LACO|nr:zinc ribbon domain-containing protein [Apilactobacillus timberlakei]TPR12777.1 zinc ribbon domain-containing protein [Apilactobacillus timberlakei]TPR13660.1 zinc ribbon domain-containing protein [Apilactobacillus timberlakei]